MTKVLITESYLTDIADAIREVDGTTDTYTPSEMGTAIRGLTTADETLTANFISTIDATYGANCTELPAGITAIGKYAFYKCTDLALKTLPEGVTIINDYAFSGCTYLALTSLPESLETICSYAFQSCSTLALTSLPDNIEKIESYAFSGCSGLALTKLPSSLGAGFSMILFNYGIEHYAFRNCTKLAITSVPSGVTKIQTGIFYGCTGLTELTFEGKVSTINAYAFYGCTYLNKIAFPNITDVPELSNTNAFVSCGVASTGYIYVPDSLVDSVKAATNWSTYADRIKGTSEL